MKKTAIIFIFLLLGLSGSAQSSFKTIVPKRPVVSGESFQVQYILEDGEKTATIKPPMFKNFRFVAGPNIYIGSASTSNGVKALWNAVYTLEAMRPGKFVISGATITVNGKMIRSNDAIIEVVSEKEAIKRFNSEKEFTPSDYFLKTGENPYEKIRQNLFLKLIVDKNTCFVGEPVLAVFKLFSRLESKSDIVKNPGFYGFTVYDMVNLTNKQVATETINGKIFDVHTIRKVQLYPLQAGAYTIDAMEVKNKVAFSKSAVSKKAEQEIAEGLLGNNDFETPDEGTEVYETELSTEPVIIRVKPVPEKSRPAAFNGAAGNFTISSGVVNKMPGKYEEDYFEIRISGEGNFIQLSAPTVQWPAGMEGFEPEVKDVLDKTKMPLTGIRTFRYPFVSAAPGVYIIPAVHFAFFDLDSGNYKTVTAPAIEVHVRSEEKAGIITISTGKKNQRKKIATLYWLVIAGILALGCMGLIRVRRKDKPVQKSELAGTMNLKPNVVEMLAPVYLKLPGDDPDFYMELQQSIWRFFNLHFQLTGSEMKKEVLKSTLIKRGIDKGRVKELEDILQLCETGMFTNSSPASDKNVLLQETKQLLEVINSCLL
ncbi:MAG: BatD family protein [Chitinophagaceae bacterium]